MKATFLSLLGAAALLSVASSAEAQTRTVTAAKAPAKPAAAKTPTAKPASTTTARTTAAKPAAAVAAAPVAAAEPAQPVAKPAKETGKAQSSSSALFAKGTTVANLGVGAGLGYGYYGAGGLKSIPALSLSVERGILDGIGPGTIGVGAMVGYKGYSYDYGGSQYKATWSNIYLGLRGTYHYDLLDNPKLDTYAGISLGVRIEKYKDTYYDEVLGGDRYSYGGAYAYPGFFVGGRYFFTDNIGGFAEFGYDMSYLKVGVSAKF